MKKLFIAAALLLPMAAHAVPENVSLLCYAKSSTAQAIMESRHDGLPKEDLLDIVDSAQHKLWVLEAYATPRLYDPLEVQNSIVRFGHKAYLECVEALQ